MLIIYVFSYINSVNLTLRWIKERERALQGVICGRHITPHAHVFEEVLSCKYLALSRCFLRAFSPCLRSII